MVALGPVLVKEVCFGGAAVRFLVVGFWMLMRFLEQTPLSRILGEADGFEGTPREAQGNLRRA